MSGRLRVVATPIGNLDDFSPRAVEALTQADVVFCEDTRVTRKLLTIAGSRARLRAVNAQTEAREAAKVAAEVATGSEVVLVTDAGTPGISDPGRLIVATCREQGLRVEVIPGPSAAIAALVASGFHSARFCVEGFLPQTGKARRRRLEKLATEERTLVIYEGPHRLVDTLTDMADAFGDDRPVALCRELTKVHEEVILSTIGELCSQLEVAAVKGECTLVIEGAEPASDTFDEEEVRALLLQELEAGSTKRDAVAAVVKATGASKRLVFDVATSI